MTRKVFHSFRYSLDSHRVQQVRNIGALEGQSSLSANAWEDKKNAGDAAVQAWIDSKMSGRSCVIVFIGRYTANRKWINYEIKKGWNDGKGVLGVRIHNLKNLASEQTVKGANPLDYLTVNGTKLSSIAKTYDPPYTTSTYVYNNIKENLEDWVEAAIKIRDNY
jgi:hypothetical protein